MIFICVSRMVKTRKYRSRRSYKRKSSFRLRGGELVVKRSITPIRRVSIPSLQIQTPKYVNSFQNNNTTSYIETLYTEKNKSQKVNIGVLTPNIQSSTQNTVTSKIIPSIVKTRKNRKA
jgi:hypothetical protein